MPSFASSWRHCVVASLNRVCANVDTFVRRCVTGLFNGSSAVAIAFLSDICSGQERSDLVARQGALQAGAFIIGPCFGGVLTSISPLVSLLLLCRVGGLGASAHHVSRRHWCILLCQSFTLTSVHMVTLYIEHTSRRVSANTRRALCHWDQQASSGQRVVVRAHSMLASTFTS